MDKTNLKKPSRKMWIGGAAIAALALGGAIYGIRHIGSSAWLYARTTDPMTDVPTAVMRTRSPDGAILAVGCTDGKSLRLTIETKYRLTSYSEGALERVIDYRFDDKPVADTVGELRDHVIGFENIAGKDWDGPIIAGLPGTEKLAIKFAEGGFVFPTTGASRMIEKVREGCKRSV